MNTNTIEPWQLSFRQALPLDLKEAYTAKRIKKWYNTCKGDVYISFSGGKDSTVLLHQVRRIYPDITAVFVDTGLEFPEIREFVKTIRNVVWTKPTMTFKQVLEKYGYPLISKEVSQKIYEARTTKSAKLLHKRLHGDANKYRSGRIPLKWQYLINAPFAISHRCCHYLKIKPLHQYEKASGKYGFVGLMASDSHARKQKYMKQGCNSFGGSKKQSIPMAFWVEQDIWDYIKKYNLPYSTIYGKGYNNTGCMFCLFGVHREKYPNKFQTMQGTHPKLWDYCINQLGCGIPLSYINVDYDRKAGGLWQNKTPENLELFLRKPSRVDPIKVIACSSKLDQAENHTLAGS